MKKNISLNEIIVFLGEELIAMSGNPDGIYIHYLKDPSAVDEFTLDWINPLLKDKQQLAMNSKAKAILVGPGTEYTEEIKCQGKIILHVENPKLSLAKIGHKFFVDKPLPGIHSSAFIHPDAMIGENVFIGPNSTIGNCKIGNNVIIYSNVVINDEVQLGNNVIVKPGSILGFEGFGYEKDLDGTLIKFPQLGKLIIHDFVEIGANTCIDKGALSDTVIGVGTKINNLCHIAHNVVIGRNVIITAHVNISGSTTIEDNVWISPNSSLRGHQHIGMGATIGMGAVVTKNVPSGETWIGNPAKKME